MEDRLIFEEIGLDDSVVGRSGITREHIESLIKDYVFPVLDSYFKRSKNEKYIKEIRVKNCNVHKFEEPQNKWEDPSALVYFDIMLKMTDDKKVYTKIRAHPRLKLTPDGPIVWNYWFKRFQNEKITRVVKHWLELKDREALYS